MNLPFFIAKRYFVSKKKQNIINIISAISVTGIIVGTFALVVVLSVFNGFNSLIESFFSSFDPDIKITSVEGKMFNPAEFNFDKVNQVHDILHYAEVIEEIALLKYGSQQYPAIVKGVPANYAEYTHIDSLIVDGNFTLENQGLNYAAVGQGVAYNLGIGLTFVDPIRIYVPKKGKQSTINLARAINYDYIYPSGVFSVLEEIDSKYILVPFQFASELFESKKQISAVELGFANSVNIKKVQKSIKNILGEKFHVKNKYQQHDLIYKTLKSEKWAAYFILVFILIIASFNILSSLSMLIIDKKDDIIILRSMGAQTKLIRQIFLFEGWLISSSGAIIGSLLGIFICWLQIEFGLIDLPGNGSFVISAYPVKIILSDILLVLSIVLLIGFIASWYPIKYISRKYLLS
ncbi:MAG: ABC transporter permease [Prolixibacteraceae bacterium]|nr:ABC transporter permease [Prolixibacteraceae bacterium]MBT6766244.1 ABC transporter permease [Prolixibacteraceae bacterium]MBT7000574.1 ABC transporter permease [Prolixibacteraceae bacterium]MBT7393522.1 ABC transporter permease [Prolixibacteraceae bacterium]